MVEISLLKSERSFLLTRTQMLQLSSHAGGMVLAQSNILTIHWKCKIKLFKVTVYFQKHTAVASRLNVAVHGAEKVQ